MISCNFSWLYSGEYLRFSYLFRSERKSLIELGIEGSFLRMGSIRAFVSSMKWFMKLYLNYRLCIVFWTELASSLNSSYSLRSLRMYSLSSVVFWMILKL